MASVPTVHMNGTPREELERQAIVAGRLLNDAMNALSAMAPNGRDYYPQGPDAISMAVAEHHARLAKVGEVRDEVIDLIGYLLAADVPGVRPTIYSGRAESDVGGGQS